MLVKTINSTYEFDLDLRKFRKINDTEWRDGELVSKIKLGERINILTMQNGVPWLIITSEVLSIIDNEPALAWTTDP